MNKPEDSAAGSRTLTAADVPLPGERAFIVGQTGSGKTQFAVWLLERLTHSPIVIYDTKGEPLFEAMPRSALAFDQAGVFAALSDPQIDYVIHRVHPTIIADGDALDALLWFHFQNMRGVDLYIDEVFSFSQNGRAGPGLVAMLTQGRSHGFTCLMAAQRPSWLARFVITEAQRYYIFRLVDKKDRARLGDVIPEFADAPIPPKFEFWYYHSGDDAPELIGKVPLDVQKPREDNPPEETPPEEQTGDPDQGTALNWL